MGWFRLLEGEEWSIVSFGGKTGGREEGGGGRGSELDKRERDERKAS